MSEEKNDRTVVCAKLKTELPAMIYRPFRDDLGERIYQEISQDAWGAWIEHSKMLVNEYRLDLSSEKAHTLLKEQCDEFLFGEGAGKMPPDFVPSEG